MMAKLGKYSTGLKGSIPMSSYAGDGNKGYSQKQNMMGDNGLTKHEKQSLTAGVSAQGVQKTLRIDKRVKRKM